MTVTPSSNRVGLSPCSVAPSSTVAVAAMPCARRTSLRSALKRLFAKRGWTVAGRLLGGAVLGLDGAIGLEAHGALLRTTEPRIGGERHMIGGFETILNLVGPLDDATGENTSRERFREYLASQLTGPAQVRDAVQTCVTNTGMQYARALQDLVNHLARLMGFDVEFGRYQGVVNQVGHDGLWRSGSRVVVVEVKTTDAFVVDHSTVLNYITSLRAAQRISPSDDVIGLFVYARKDAKVQQLQNGILADKRTQELRIASVDAVVSLTELIRQDLIAHDEAIDILWPSGVWVDDTVKLLQRISAGSGERTGRSDADDTPRDVEPEAGRARRSAGSPDGGPEYYLTPVADIPEESAEETITRLVARGLWAMSNGTPHRAKIKPGDFMAFYRAGVGVVATAEVATAPQERPRPEVVKNPDKYRWTFELRNPTVFLDSPVLIDATMRSLLDEFRERDLTKPWSWFVFANRRITPHDYALLTGKVPDPNEAQ